MNRLLPSIFLTSAGICAAQFAPAPVPLHSSSTPSAPAGGGPVMLDKFVTSATPFGRNQVELAQSTTVLGGRELALKQQPTIGETLAGEAGISSTAYGPGASRPIIRGLGGDRIRVLENSVGTIDASVTSPDHAVSIEPFLIERIEVVRGPASLLYGSSAVGGVVNVLTHRIETEMPVGRVRGGGKLRLGSGSDEIARGGMVDVALVHAPTHAVILHLDGFRRSTGELRIPGFAESDRVREAEAAEAAAHGEAAPDFARGRLPNSSIESEGGAAGLSFVSSRLQIGVSRSVLDTDYGVPGHAHEHEEEEHEPAGADGVRIALRQRRTDVQAEFRNGTGIVSTVRFKLGLADYNHAEREPDGTVGTVFTNTGHEARLELLHGRAAWSGAIGLQIGASDFAAAGEEAFLPPSRTSTGALFVFQEIVREPLTWQFGARVERSQVRPEGGGVREQEAFSGSAGAVWKLGDAHSLALSLAHTGRAPNAQELFADGPHAGTRSFEIGAPALSPERSFGAELSLRRRTGRITGTATVYANRFHGFIFEQPAGLVAIEHGGEWEFVPAGDDADAHGEGLPVYNYVQQDARFRGAELEVVCHLHEAAGHQLDLRLSADFTRGRTSGGDLPRIPAERVTAGVSWAHGPWSAGIDGQYVFSQHRVAAAEAPSAGYTLVSADAGCSFTAGRTSWSMFVRGTNLTDREARPHTSFVKDLAPLGGRAVTAGLRVSF